MQCMCAMHVLRSGGRHGQLPRNCAGRTITLDGHRGDHRGVCICTCEHPVAPSASSGSCCTYEMHMPVAAVTSLEPCLYPVVVEGSQGVHLLCLGVLVWCSCGCHVLTFQAALQR